MILRLILHDMVWLRKITIGFSFGSHTKMHGLFTLRAAAETNQILTQGPPPFRLQASTPHAPGRIAWSARPRAAQHRPQRFLFR